MNGTPDNDFVEEFRLLEYRLSHLAAIWRSSWGSPIQDEVLQEYHAIVLHLFALGWDDYLDADVELADEFMPEEYRRRKPRLRGWG